VRSTRPITNYFQTLPSRSVQPLPPLPPLADTITPTPIIVIPPSRPPPATSDNPPVPFRYQEAEFPILPPPVSILPPHTGHAADILLPSLGNRPSPTTHDMSLPTIPPPLSPSTSITSIIDSPYCVHSHLLQFPPIPFRYHAEETTPLSSTGSIYTLISAPTSSFHSPSKDSQVQSMRDVPPSLPTCRQRQPRVPQSSGVIRNPVSLSSPSSPSSLVHRNLFPTTIPPPTNRQVVRTSAVDRSSTLNPRALPFEPSPPPSSVPLAPVDLTDRSTETTTTAQRWRTLFNYSHDYRLSYLQPSRAAATHRGPDKSER
jgi:hypothetical protein